MELWVNEAHLSYIAQSLNEQTNDFLLVNSFNHVSPLTYLFRQRL